MKTKNLIYSTLLGVVVSGGAFASMTTEEMKEVCNQYPDEYVWLDNTEVCIPANPCKDGTKEEQQLYCNRVFSDVETATVSQASKLAEEWLVLNGQKEVNCFLGGQTGREYSLFGQNYIACTTRDVRYMVFEFDDTTNMEIGNERFEEKEKAIAIFCNMLGGDKFSYNYCRGISEKDCERLGNIYVAVYKDYETKCHDFDNGLCQVPFCEY